MARYKVSEHYTWIWFVEAPDEQSARKRAEDEPLSGADLIECGFSQRLVDLATSQEPEEDDLEFEDENATA